LLLFDAHYQIYLSFSVDMLEYNCQERFNAIWESVAAAKGDNGMPRPRKQKLICEMPRCNTFGPCSGCASEPVNMSLEEYEVIRLIDHEDMDQTQCADVMGVARSTVQRLYTDARRKLSDCLVSGRMLHIGGGDYTLCERRMNPEECAGCHRRGRHGRPFGQD
jgi:predicted DNA-binding protein (UPF0251 family)